MTFQQSIIPSILEGAQGVIYIFYLFFYILFLTIHHQLQHSVEECLILVVAMRGKGFSGVSDLACALFCHCCRFQAISEAYM